MKHTLENLYRVTNSEDEDPKDGLGFRPRNLWSPSTREELISKVEQILEIVEQREPYAAIYGSLMRVRKIVAILRAEDAVNADVEFIQLVSEGLSLLTETVKWHYENDKKKNQFEAEGVDCFFRS